MARWPAAVKGSGPGRGRYASMIRGLITLFACALAGISVAAPEVPMRPFQTSYEVLWKGFTGGIASFDLRQDPAGTWTYTNTNRPHGLFRLVSKASLTLTSRMSVDPDGVRP